MADEQLTYAPPVPCPACGRPLDGGPAAAVDRGGKLATRATMLRDWDLRVEAERQTVHAFLRMQHGQRVVAYCNPADLEYATAVVAALRDEFGPLLAAGPVPTKDVEGDVIMYGVGLDVEPDPAPEVETIPVDGFDS